MTSKQKIMNIALRKKIVAMIAKVGAGHIPSAFSIVEILDYLYARVLKFDPQNPQWEGRDYFVLSKGHGCAALYVLLEQYGFITQKELDIVGKMDGILGGHPDSTRVPGVEACTGSLGHGIGTALGIALGLKIRKKNNKVIAVIGDGESNEGTVWECAMVGANLKLGNLCCIVDNNGSSAPILPMANLKDKWGSFGWEVHEIDGHNEKEIDSVFQKIKFDATAQPKVVIANTAKGKGVSFMEVHGPWHYRAPNPEELKLINDELDSQLLKKAG